MKLTVLFLTVLSFTFHNAIAKNGPEKGISVSNGHTSVIRPGQEVIAVYIESIVNSSPEDIVLISATSKLAQKVEFHSMQIVENRMKMKIEDNIIIPAQSQTSISKGNSKGYHLMLLNISPELEKKTMLELVLSFSNGQHILCNISVRKYSKNK